MQLLDLTTNKGEEQTVFHYAARNGSYETLILLKRILDLNEFKRRIELRDSQGRTCLYLAAEYGIFKFKLKKFNIYINLNNNRK